MNILIKISKLVLILLLFSITSIMAEDTQGIRVSILGGSGEFELATGDALNGDFNHDLDGSALSVSYNRTNENKLFFGGGFQRVGTNSESWEYGTEYNSSSYSYYSSTYGYFDAGIKVLWFKTDFIYGLIGYEVNINENWVFQPNLKLGQKTMLME